MTDIGTKVELIRTTDEHTNLKRGDRGIVTFVDSLGTVSVKWENGSTLGLIPGEDAWWEVSESDEEV